MSTERDATRVSGDLTESLAAALRNLSGIGVVSGYLFGSHATGRAHRESDVDVGILLSWALDRERRFDARVRLATELPATLGVRDVDVVVLNDASPLLGRRIALDGKRVFCGDPEADRAFRRDVQLRAADVAPFLEWTRRLKLEALAR